MLHRTRSFDPSSRLSKLACLTAFSIPACVAVRGVSREGMGFSDCEHCDGVNSIDATNGRNRWVAGPRSNQSYVVLQDVEIAQRALDDLLCQGRMADRPLSPPAPPVPSSPPHAPKPQAELLIHPADNAVFFIVAAAAIVLVLAVVAVRANAHAPWSRRRGDSLPTQDAAWDEVDADDKVTRGRRRGRSSHIRK